MAEPILEVKDLVVHFPTDDGVVKAVDGVSFQVMPGETLGVVGESGSGKSVTFLSALGLTGAKNARISGQVLFRGQDLLTLPEEEMRAIRGAKISMIFQDPMTSLHPYYKVGKQIAEAVVTHRDVSKKEAWEVAVDMLGKVGIPKPRERADQYPHEFSGGMRQRAMIAMALCLDPDLLIADEPTTALDVTVQAQILEVIQRIQERFRTAVVLITHDLGVIARVAHRVNVLYAGRNVELATADELFARPSHPYTQGLLASLPHEGQRRLTPITGFPPNMLAPPPGCGFAPRCGFVAPECEADVPGMRALGSSSTACVRAEAVALKLTRRGSNG